MGPTLEPRDLHCRKNGCGYYGNPEWNWYCSKCWREHNDFHNRMSPSSRSRESGLSKSKSFSKFEDKKKRHIDRAQNLKHIFRKSNLKESSVKRAVSSISSQRLSSRWELSPEAKAVSNEFATFLNERMERTGIADISSHVKAVIDRVFKTVEVVAIDDVSETVQEFYQLLQKRLETHPLFQGLSNEDRTAILNYSEKYIMTCCYKSLFCPVTSNDEDEDLEIQNRIRSLNWISTKDLKCCISESSQEVRDLLYSAINDILEMDGKIPPQEKMDCLVRCCKNIFEMLKVSNESPASADEFLPCLIYVCLKANPPRIKSNINFITKFCNENKLRMGEGGYFFANLCCAMSFIENLDAKSINMDPIEFDNYVSGRAVPPGSWQSSLLMCEGLQVMSQNLKNLSDLKVRHDRLFSEATKLKEEMTEFQKDIEENVEAVIQRTEYKIRGPHKDYRCDKSDKSNINILPSPVLATNSIPNKLDPLLEDYSNTPETMSLLSFDISYNEDSKESQQPMTEYRGFSAQSFSIPNISCNNAICEKDCTNDNNENDDDDDDTKTYKLVQVLGGMFNTFDNII